MNHSRLCRPRNVAGQARAGVFIRALKSSARLALVVMVAAFACGRARPALAHAVLVRSDPAANAKLPDPPKVISIYFSESLEPKFSSVKVVDTAGNELDEHDSRVDAGDAKHMTLDVKPLKAGFYNVLWTTVSKVDGHELQGSFPFIVLNPDGSTPAGSAPALQSAGAESGTAATGPGDIIGFWLAVLGAVGLLGGILFVLAIAQPAAGAADDHVEEMRDQSTRIELRVLWLCMGLLIVGLLIILALQLARLGGISTLGEFLTTSYGQYWAARLALAVLAGLILSLLQLFPEPDLRAPLLTLVGFFGLAIIVCFSLTAHADAVGNGSFWATISDLIHLLAVSIWVGGLLSLTALLLASRRILRQPTRVRYHAALVSRFSPLAAGAVVFLILTGLFNAVVEVPSLHGLISTAYGRTLLVKVGVAVLLLGAGGLNAFLLRPRLVAESASGVLVEATRLQRRLYRTVALEAGLAVLVILVTAWLVVLAPTRDLLAAGPRAVPQANGSSVYRNSAQANDLTVQFNVDPNRTGLNTFRVTLSDASGPVSNASLVRLQFTYSDPKFGTSELPLPGVGNGVYEASGANFAQVGRWRVTAEVQRAGKDDALTSFSVEVPDTSGNLTGTQLTTTDPFASPSKLFTTDELGGIVLALLGIVPFILRKPIWDRSVVAGAAGTFLGVSALILGATLFFATHQEGTTNYALLNNPVPVDNASVADGRTLYMQNCVICHGQTGHGDGPAARGLNPQPVDLTVHVGLHPDGVLWGWITYGIPRTAMPSWKDKLTDAQRWDVVNFLREDFQATAAQAPADSSDASETAVAARQTKPATGESHVTP